MKLAKKSRIGKYNLRNKCVIINADDTSQKYIRCPNETSESEITDEEEITEKAGVVPPVTAKPRYNDSDESQEREAPPRHSFAHMKTKIDTQTDGDKLNPIGMLMAAVVLACCLILG